MNTKSIKKSLLENACRATVLVAFGALNIGSASAADFDPGVLNPSLLDEIRFGVHHHDLHVAGVRDERGVDINGEILFRRPGFRTGSRFLDFAFNPRPHIGGHLNTKKFTSQAYVGITWDYKFYDNFFFEASFGGAYHTGNLKTNIAGQKRPLGCRVIFRESMSLGYELTENWRVMLSYDHISNGGLCSINAGLSTIGGRMGYKF